MIATVIAVIVPLGSTVYRFRRSVVVPLAQSLPALSFVPGAHATQIRVPSAVNFQPDGWVSSPTAIPDDAVRSHRCASNISCRRTIDPLPKRGNFTGTWSREWLDRWQLVLCE